MKARNFSLDPFSPDADNPLCLKIQGRIERSSGRLSVCFHMLLGCSGDVLVPEPAPMPSRKMGLWEETCMEFFLAVKGLSPYWEFNLSPSGHWNVFHFSDYRQGMREESAFVSLPFRICREPGALSLALDLNLGGLVRAAEPLAIAASAVVKLRSGHVTYWALTHRGLQPDFHRRDSFVIEV